MGEKAIRIRRHDFDNLENRVANAHQIEELGLFAGNRMIGPFAMARQYIERLEPQKLYVGWDEQVYPKFELVTEWIERPEEDQ